MKLTNKEYNVLNKISHESKMDCWFSIATNGREDYILDLEENKKLKLKDGVGQLYDGLTDLNDYNLSYLEKETFTTLLVKLKIKEDFQVNTDLNKLLNVMNKGKEIKELDGKEWVENYDKLIKFLYAIGNLTEKRHEIEEIVKVLDEIDTLGY